MLSNVDHIPRIVTHYVGRREAMENDGRWTVREAASERVSPARLARFRNYIARLRYAITRRFAPACAPDSR